MIKKLTRPIFMKDYLKGKVIVVERSKEFLLLRLILYGIVAIWKWYYNFFDNYRLDDKKVVTYKLV